MQNINVPNHLISQNGWNWDAFVYKRTCRHYKSSLHVSFLQYNRYYKYRRVSPLKHGRTVTRRTYQESQHLNEESLGQNHRLMKYHSQNRALKASEYVPESWWWMLNIFPSSQMNFRRSQRWFSTPVRTTKRAELLLQNTNYKIQNPHKTLGLGLFSTMGRPSQSQSMIPRMSYEYDW